MKWLLDLFPGKIWIYAIIVSGAFAAGGALGVKWELDAQVRAELAAAQARESDAIQQRKFGDKAAGDHAKTLAIINNKLGGAYAQIALLSGRECFGADTAGMLSTIGSEPGPAAAGESAGAPPAAAAGTGLRYTTDRDAAGYIALCRGRYAEVASQLNQILDIEDRRHPPN